MSALDTLDVGQANELKLAFRRAGWTNEDVKWLSEGGILAEVLRVRRGDAEIREAEHVIDCNADPFVPEGWTVEEHQKGGSFKWDPAQVQLYLSELQLIDGVIKGNALRKELAGKPVLNANVLDYLLAHPRLIPEEWKKNSEGCILFIFFWGTIYRDPDGHLCVRCLCWHSGRWGWNYYWFLNDWHVTDPAALGAS